MLPNIKDGDFLRTVKLDSNSRQKLMRGDIVVFRSPINPTKSYIKRLIGLPGDRIEIRRGEVWLNDAPLPEAYVSAKLNGSQRSHAVMVVPQQTYYILGDNRDNSADSRIWGPVSAGLIDAKVVGK
jgi:signal peptidase I